MLAQLFRSNCRWCRARQLVPKLQTSNFRNCTIWKVNESNIRKNHETKARHQNFSLKFQFQHRNAISCLLPSTTRTAAAVWVQMKKRSIAADYKSQKAFKRETTSGGRKLAAYEAGAKSISIFLLPLVSCQTIVVVRLANSSIIYCARQLEGI